MGRMLLRRDLYITAERGDLVCMQIAGQLFTINCIKSL
jgi:hypothetical protein